MDKDLMELSQAEFDRLSRMKDTGIYSYNILPKQNVMIDTTHVDVDQLDLHPSIYKRHYDIAYEIYNGNIPQDMLWPAPERHDPDFDLF